MGQYVWLPYSLPGVNLGLSCRHRRYPSSNFPPTILKRPHRHRKSLRMADSNDPRVHKTVTAPSMSIFQKDIFNGKVLFCTGGGSGICKGMTEQIMKHGANAAIVGRKADRLNAAAKSMEEAAGNGTKCIAAPGDVRKFEDLKAAVQKTIDTFGRIDFVICGAAGNFLAPIEGVSPNGFATVQQIDLQGTFNTVKATLDELKRTHGVYTHISATLHYTGIPWQAAASAAKAGIDALSQSIAVEMGPFGIRSNVIAPGMISGTEGADRLTPKGAESMVESRIPQQRIGVIDDIANMGVYLFSDAGAYCSGARFVRSKISSKVLEMLKCQSFPIRSSMEVHNIFLVLGSLIQCLHSILKISRNWS